jgi:TPR repeat protein
LDASDHSCFLVSTPTAARLTGKNRRTIINWLETGTAKGNSHLSSHLPQGQSWQVDLFSIAEHIHLALTDAFLEDVKKSEAGDTLAMVHIALCFYNTDQQKIAADWFDVAAKAGNTEAMEWLWEMYYKGQGVEKNLPVAIQWLGKAAEQGSLLAQVAISVLQHTDVLTITEDAMRNVHQDITKWVDQRVQSLKTDLPKH